MPRNILLLAGLTLFSGVFGLSQSVDQSTTTTPINVPFGGPILATPTATFPTPAPTAGISDAGRAGISSEANSMVPPETTIGSFGTATIGPATNSASPVAPPEATPANDLGPSVFVAGASGTPGSGTTSLAEISSRYKASKNTHNARLLSNEDVEKLLSNKSGVIMAKNMPPLGPGALEQSGQAQNSASQTTQAAQTNSQSTQTNASSNQQAQTGTTGQGGTPPPASTQSNSPASGSSAENSTTPQINQNQQSNDAQGSHRLPATATLLPLLGLLGLASGGIGFWFRRFRK